MQDHLCYDIHKLNIFSLGLTFLQVALLEKNVKIVKFLKSFENEEFLSSIIDTIQYPDDIKSVIKNMLKNEETLRLDS